MLEQINLSKKLSKKEYRPLIESLNMKLSFLQRECKNLKIPIVILFEGLGASGKGTMIRSLIEPLDPRGFQVYATGKEGEEEQMRPFLWRFWKKLPANGTIGIFDRGWYRKVLVDRFDQKTSSAQLEYAYDEINTFEKQITDEGAVLVKFFLYISKEEQKKRFDTLLADKKTAWRVTKDDIKRNKHFEEYEVMNEEMLEKTDVAYAPWNVIEAMNKEFAAVKILSVVVKQLENAIVQKQKEKNNFNDAVPAAADEQDSVSELKLRATALEKADLSLSLTKEEYKIRLEKLQDKIADLHNQLYRKRIPVIIVFEGWDASGKGGAIKRLTQKMDPRGYAVYPTAAPNDIEKAHHYLWRFWNTFPKAGHLSIYDRSWYGRVMVERIEGFCTEDEWKRAYKEINDMEKQCSNYGAVILKFWMHIDREEQEKRFNERKENPEKQWKITEEDWRNRSRWELYEDAVNEMLVRTSTTYAPWCIVEGNSKYYARVKVLETVVEALEDRLAKHKAGK